MIKRIYINKHIIRANEVYNKNDPPITVATYKGIERCHLAFIDGPCEVVYARKHPLKCGARAWIETTAEVRTI